MAGSISLAAALLCAGQAQAWPPLYGPEFTFTNQRMLDAQGEPNEVTNGENEKARDEMGKRLEKRCRQRKNCRTRSLTSAYGTPVIRVEYDDGWWFQIATDPAVVEIQAKPATAADFARMRMRIQEDIFELAAEMAMHPHATVGGGHIHVGLESAFDGDPKLFRNFVVDFANHPELGTGILGKDHKNAPPLSVLPEKYHEAFTDILRRFDKGEIKTIQGLASKINTRVYDWTPGGPQWTPSTKYQEVNLLRITDKKFKKPEKTVEIRSIRSQRGAHEFVRQIQLFEARLEYLKTLKAPLPFNPPATFEDILRNRNQRFYEYVTEAGLPWNDYRQYVPSSFVPAAVVPKNSDCPYMIDVLGKLLPPD